jgi:TPR repeat protein
VEYKVRADQGDADSLFYLGGMYVTGHGVTKNLTKGVELIQLAAQKGNPLAKKILGVMK